MSQKIAAVELSNEATKPIFKSRLMSQKIAAVELSNEATKPILKIRLMSLKTVQRSDKTNSQKLSETGKNCLTKRQN
jgi:hypothetical protein